MLSFTIANMSVSSNYLLMHITHGIIPCRLLNTSDTIKWNAFAQNLIRICHLEDCMTANTSQSDLFEPILPSSKKREGL